MDFQSVSSETICLPWLETQQNCRFGSTELGGLTAVDTARAQIINRSSSSID